MTDMPVTSSQQFCRAVHWISVVDPEDVPGSTVPASAVDASFVFDVVVFEVVVLDEDVPFVMDSAFVAEELSDSSVESTSSAHPSTASKLVTR